METCGKDDVILSCGCKGDFWFDDGGYWVVFTPNEEVSLLWQHLNIIIIQYPLHYKLESHGIIPSNSCFGYLTTPFLSFYDHYPCTSTGTRNYRIATYLPCLGLAERRATA